MLPYLSPKKASMEHFLFFFLLSAACCMRTRHWLRPATSVEEKEEKRIDSPLFSAVHARSVARTVEVHAMCGHTTVSECDKTRERERESSLPTERLTEEEREREKALQRESNHATSQRQLLLRPRSLSGLLLLLLLLLLLPRTHKWKQIASWRKEPFCEWRADREGFCKRAFTVKEKEPQALWRGDIGCQGTWQCKKRIFQWKHF